MILLLTSAALLLTVASDLLTMASVARAPVAREDNSGFHVEPRQ